MDILIVGDGAIDVPLQTILSYGTRAVEGASPYNCPLYAIFVYGYAVVGRDAHIPPP